MSASASPTGSLTGLLPSCGQARPSVIVASAVVGGLVERRGVTAGKSCTGDHDGHDCQDHPLQRVAQHSAGSPPLLFANRVVGWATGPRATTELVLTALNHALRSRQVRAGEFIHHSDKGA